MPELPEVETVKRAIDDAVVQHQIIDVVTSGKKMRWPIPEDINEQIITATVKEVLRRGKYILITTKKDDEEKVILIHLGMSGSVRIYDKGQEFNNQPHDHMIIRTDHKDGGKTLVLNDPRRFGGVDIIPKSKVENHTLLKNMGIEPFDQKVSSRYLKQAFAGKNTSIKSAILDQNIIAGIGNIYASEALYRSGISPKRKAKNVSENKLNDLIIAIQSVLKEAIAQGGTSLRDHVQPGGEIGYFVQSLDVYGRSGQNCKKCEQKIKEIRQSGRTTFYCSGCQR